MINDQSGDGDPKVRMEATANDKGSNTQAGRDIIHNTYVGVRAKYLVGAAVVVALAVTAWVLIGAGTGGGDHQDAAGGARHGAVQPTPSTHSPKPAGVPKKLIDAEPFALRAPADFDSTTVDLDGPKIQNGIGGSDGELQLSDIGHDWEFSTTMGISAGPGYQQCKDSIASNALPSSLDGHALNAQKTIRVGTLLCTQTSDGNLAMLEITKIAPADEDGNLPDVMTKLTVWESPPAGP